MSEIKNIPGEFDLALYIDGRHENRTVKCNFTAIEKLETKVLNKSLAETLGEALVGRIFMTDVINLLHTGLEAAKDHRLSRNALADVLYSDPQGLAPAQTVFIEFLTYAVSGGLERKAAATGEAQGQPT